MGWRYDEEGNPYWKPENRDEFDMGGGGGPPSNRTPLEYEEGGIDEDRIEEIYERFAEDQWESMMASMQFQEGMLDKLLAQQWKIYQQQREDMMPWLKAGKWALGELRGFMEEGAPFWRPPSYEGSEGAEAPEGTFDANQRYGISSAYEESPYYNFLKQEGIDARDRSAAAQGMLLSGPQQRSIEQFGQQFASTDYDNFLNRYYKAASFDRDNYYMKLAPYEGMAGFGQVGAASMIGAANNYSNVTGDAMMNVGQNVGNMLWEGGSDIAHTRASGQMNAMMIPYQYNFQNMMMEKYLSQMNCNSRRNMIGNIMSGLFNAIGGMASSSSDKRLKTDIEQVGEYNGIKIYKFRYKVDANKVEWVGVIAQDLFETHPEAVIEDGNGFYEVKYDLLGFRMTPYNQWKEHGLDTHGKFLRGLFRGNMYKTLMAKMYWLKGSQTPEQLLDDSKILEGLQELNPETGRFEPLVTDEKAHALADNWPQNRDEALKELEARATRLNRAFNIPIPANEPIEKQIGLSA